MPGKSNYVIYLLKCLLSKIQYVGKSEIPFHIRLNNHRKDIKILMLLKYANIVTTGTTPSISMGNSYYMNNLTI